MNTPLIAVRAENQPSHLIKDLERYVRVQYKSLHKVRSWLLFLMTLHAITLFLIVRYLGVD